MPAYILAEIEITNAEGYKEYSQLVPPTLEAFGGKFLHRGGPVIALEGSCEERRRVIIEFPTAQAARDWWASDTYAKPRAMRQANSNGRLLLFEGL